MRSGATGLAVQALRHVLADHGFIADNRVQLMSQNYTPYLGAAVSRYQQRLVARGRNCPRNGIFGPTTWAAMPRVDQRAFKRYLRMLESDAAIAPDLHEERLAADAAVRRELAQGSASPPIDPDVEAAADPVGALEEPDQPDEMGEPDTELVDALPTHDCADRHDAALASLRAPHPTRVAGSAELGPDHSFGFMTSPAGADALAADMAASHPDQGEGEDDRDDEDEHAAPDTVAARATDADDGIIPTPGRTVTERPLHGAMADLMIGADSAETAPPTRAVTPATNPDEDPPDYAG